MTDIQKVINESQESLGLSTEQLAELLCVPVAAINEWKKGFLPILYEPLLAFALLYFTTKKQNEKIIEEITSQTQRSNDSLRRTMEGVIKATATIVQEDGKLVLKPLEHD